MAVSALSFLHQEACPFQNPQMLGDGGQRDVEGAGQFQDGGGTAHEAKEDGPSCRVGQCEKRGIEIIFNHMVKYKSSEKHFQ